MLSHLQSFAHTGTMYVDYYACRLIHVSCVCNSEFSLNSWQLIMYGTGSPASYTKPQGNAGLTQ